MSKFINFFKNNYKYILSILLGISLSITSVYAVTLFKASEISYTPSNSSFSVSNVSQALDYLYSRAGSLGAASSKDNNVVFEYYNSQENIDQISSDYRDIEYRVFYAKNGPVLSVCYYKERLYCFDSNNYEIEYNHLLSIFSDAPLATVISRKGTYDYNYDIDYDLTKRYCVLTPSTFTRYGDELHCYDYEGDDSEGIHVYLYSDGAVNVTDSTYGTACNLESDSSSSNNYDCTFSG